MQVKKQQLETSCVDQLTGSGLRKEYNEAVCCHPIYLTFTLNTSWEMPGWKSLQAGTKIGERNISNLRYADDTTLMAESEEKLKNLLMGVKEETEKASVKLNIKLISWHPAPSLHGK